MMNVKFMNIALLEAKKSLKKDDVPVGAVLVENDKLLTKGFNNRNKNQSVLGHAEIIVIHKANKKRSKWRLDNCDLYVTLKPCKMCMEVIREAKIRYVYYLLDPLEEKKNRYKDDVIYTKVDMDSSEVYKKELADFFVKKR